jgi:dihydrofolate reductase
VFTRTLKDVTWRNARIVHDFDPREIAAMKRQSGKDMIVFGSGAIVSQLTGARVDRRESVRRLRR